MAAYTPEQADKIRHAVAEAREAMRRAHSYSPATFARTYLAEDGLQIPGEARAPREIRQAAEMLLAVLEGRAPAPQDPLIGREMERAAIEVQWALDARSPDVVGFRLQFGRQASRCPECLALQGIDHGLGPSIFRKGEVVVLPPDCRDVAFVPVREYELEQ